MESSPALEEMSNNVLKEKGDNWWEKQLLMELMEQSVAPLGQHLPAAEMQVEKHISWKNQHFSQSKNQDP